MVLFFGCLAKNHGTNQRKIICLYCAKLQLHSIMVLEITRGHVLLAPGRWFGPNRPNEIGLTCKHFKLNTKKIFGNFWFLLQMGGGLDREGNHLNFWLRREELIREEGSIKRA